MTTGLGLGDHVRILPVADLRLMRSAARLRGAWPDNYPRHPYSHVAGRTGTVRRIETQRVGDGPATITIAVQLDARPGRRARFVVRFQPEELART